MFQILIHLVNVKVDHGHNNIVKLKAHTHTHILWSSSPNDFVEAYDNISFPKTNSC